MCGIVGAVSPCRSLPDINGRIQRALDLMTHRGPDDHGCYEAVDQGVWFGHRRLAIVELSELGHQPMLSADKAVALVFNGEIYNHKDVRAELLLHGHVFRGNSDTEVVVEAYRRWGLQCLDRLNGVFALAIHDRGEQKVHFARDRAGEKPFFYAQLQGALYFASEQTALIEISNCDRHIDPQGLVSFLARGYPLADRTLLKQCRELRPGHFATFDLVTNAFHCEQYWTVPKMRDVDAFMCTRSYEAELEGLLENAVSRQLDCDVPTCILLSGGVDSSLITAFAARKRTRIKTFTVRFPGYPEFDETEKARLIARHFGTEHIEIDGANLEPQLLLDLGHRLDSPINDSSLLPTFQVNEAVSKFCRVALGGDGADELFGGYKHYSRMLALYPFIRFFCKHDGTPFFPHVKTLISAKYRARNWLECLSLDLQQQVPNIREIASPEEVQQMLGGRKVDIDLYKSEWRALSSGQESILRNCCISDFQTYLPSNILVKSDRVSMLNSVEARAPFLDRHVIEFALGRLPDSLRANRVDRKIILKNLCVKILPKEFDLKAKRGFNLPFGAMIRSGGWRDVVSDVLQEDLGVLNKAYVRRIFNSHIAGANHADIIFGLCMLSIWIRKNRMGFA
jgi:asparagine synthase (glutamine-hydrolysing)